MVFLYFESIIFIYVLMLSTFIIVSYRMFFVNYPLSKANVLPASQTS